MFKNPERSQKKSRSCLNGKCQCYARKWHVSSRGGGAGSDDGDSGSNAAGGAGGAGAGALVVMVPEGWCSSCCCCCWLLLVTAAGCCEAVVGWRWLAVGIGGDFGGDHSCFCCRSGDAQTRSFSNQIFSRLHAQS